MTVTPDLNGPLDPEPGFPPTPDPDLPPTPGPDTGPDQEPPVPDPDIPPQPDPLADSAAPADANEPTDEANGSHQKKRKLPPHQLPRQSFPSFAFPKDHAVRKGSLSA